MAESRLPKGPSNSAGMGATPGTQQTAMNNVRSMNINPNMPVAPQVAKQGRSDYQTSISPRPPVPGPAPVQPAAPAQQAPRVVTQGMPMDPSRGYNIFSGMDAGQISGMNQTMGLSNMTSLPAVAPKMRPEIMGLNQGGDQFSARVMSGDSADAEYAEKESDNNTFQEGGVTYEYDPETGMVQGFINGSPVGGPKDLNDMNPGEEGSELENWLESLGYEGDKKEVSDYTSDELMDAGIDSALDEDIGLPSELLEAGKQQTEDKVEEYKAELAEKKQSAMDDLDDAYAGQLQSLLSGIDRQMAMAGVIGSGAHSAMINSTASQVLSSLLGEYNELNKQEIDKLAAFSSQELTDLTGYDILNLNMGEKDEQEFFQNMLAASTMLANKEELDEEDINEIINIGEFFNSTITDDINSYLQGSVGNISGVAKEAFTNVLAKIQMALLQKTLPPNPEMTKEEAVAAYVDQCAILMNAQTAYVQEATKQKEGGVGSTYEVMQYLNQLTSVYGIELPPELEDLAY